MFDHTHKLRRLASLGAVLVTATVAAPVAIADPPTIPSPVISEGAGVYHGDRLSGADRNWLTLSSGDGPAGHPTSGFDWGDAGIGAGLAFAAIVVGAGGALVIRRRTPLAH